MLFFPNSGKFKLVPRVVFVILILLILSLRGTMADDNHGQSEYLTDQATVDTVYALLQTGDKDKVSEYFKSLGEDQIVVNTWIKAQCDINNIKGDPKLSEIVGRTGIEYCLEKKYAVPAAMMLHNISSFYMPDFDENIIPEALPVVLEVTEQEVELRRKIGEEGPLLWALWSQGLANLANDKADEAIRILEQSKQMAVKADDKDAAAWCDLFIGKAKIKHQPENVDEGKQQMLEAAEVLNEIGADWEKESLPGILGSVGLKIE